MDSTRRESRAWPTLAVLALSLLLHAALLLLPLPDPQRQAAVRQSATIIVELAEIPRERPTDMPQEISEPDAVVPEGMPPDSRARPDADRAEATPGRENAASETEPPQAPATNEAGPSAERLRTQLLAAARDLGRDSERAHGSEGLEYRNTPRLPSAGGWLDQYTGRVAASIDRWRSNDGSHSARIVTGSGQVFCVRTRAPTTAEIFNPWMSSAVPMISGCGRERPDAPDRTNPWLRRPGADPE